LPWEQYDGAALGSQSQWGRRDTHIARRLLIFRPISYHRALEGLFPGGGMGLFSKKAPAGSAAPAAASGSPPLEASAAVVESLRECLARSSDGKLEDAQIDVRGHLFDSGYLDSLRSADLIAFVESRYRVRIDERELVGRLCTLEALAREIQGRSGSSP
jgi:acyl carrier protein